MVARFYDFMDEKNDAKTIRNMHPESLDCSQQKLYEFLCGFLNQPHPSISKNTAIPDCGCAMTLLLLINLQEIT